MKEIYDNVYDQIDNYDKMYRYKINLIDDQFKSFSKEIKILDIGCGKGHYIKHLMKQGYTNILGIEFSSACSKKFLQNIPHLNVDFLEHCTKISNKDYDVCLCMDVLEHIPYERIEFMIDNISRIGKLAILGVANHSDVLMGEELHLIQEDADWWTNLLRKKFKSVKKSFEDETGKFFLFVCEPL